MKAQRRTDAKGPPEAFLELSEPRFGRGVKTHGIYSPDLLGASCARRCVLSLLFLSGDRCVGPDKTPTKNDASARAAHISENVYERHEDLMRDAAGDVSNRRGPQRFGESVTSLTTDAKDWFWGLVLLVWGIGFGGIGFGAIFFWGGIGLGAPTFTSEDMCDLAISFDGWNPLKNGVT